MITTSLATGAIINPSFSSAPLPNAALTATLVCAATWMIASTGTRKDQGHRWAETRDWAISTIVRVMMRSNDSGVRFITRKCRDLRGRLPVNHGFDDTADGRDYEDALDRLSEHHLVGLPEADVWSAYAVYMRCHDQNLRGWFANVLRKHPTLRPFTEVDDLVNSTFLKLGKAVIAGKFDPEDPDGGEGGLLYWIARKIWATHVQKILATQADSLDEHLERGGVKLSTDPRSGDHSDPTAIEASDRITLHQLRRLCSLADLGQVETEIVVLGYRLGRQPADLVADVLNIEAYADRSPAQRVYDLRHSGRKKLQKYLRAHPGYDPRTDS